MLERKTSCEKNRKHSEVTKKRIPCKFSRLFQFSEICLPTELQKFVSSDRGLSEADFPRNNTSKIRVVLKINEIKDTPSCLTINKNQNCVGLIDPTPSRRSQTSNSNINLFPFDSIFTESDQQSALLSSAIVDPILDFFKGKDACIFTFGNAGLGKTKTMIGSDQSVHDIGIIPCALVWVFKVMEQLKLNRNTRYAIRISALEIADKNIVRDLLTNSGVSGGSTNPGSFLLEKSNTVLSNQKELPAGSLLEATGILDSILAARSIDSSDSLTHLQLIIHLYQYQLDTKSVDTVNKPVLGGRSRLHFLDLGSGRHGNDDSSILSLQGMSKVILALYTSQRHIPYKDNVLTQLLKETLNVNSTTTMLVHISSKEQNYNDTLQIVQLASKLYRSRSRKSRSVGFLIADETSSCSSSSSGLQNRRLRPHMGIGATRRSSGNSSASSELDLTSASELSCCETVIFRGNVNTSGSEKSFEQRSMIQNAISASSESDFITSDKESSQDCVSSTNMLSPSAIRRRKISPRTNARAWPSPNTGTSAVVENGPELWVDGPNAVYKSDKNKQPKHSDHTNQKSISKEPNLDLTSPNIIKPGMISKETQCDDVWDSSSSFTDGSSHSNTLDRKDHRPLSDISECTEETESNLATESENIKINIMNDMCPLNDLDDLLDSTFGLSPLHQEMQHKICGRDINYSTRSSNTPLAKNTPSEKENINKRMKDERMKEPEKSTLKDKETDKSAPVFKDVLEVKKHYHSAGDSKRSTKSEHKERKIKSKCKKCCKKSSDDPSTSMSSSNSTDFSRVASWIQKVEYEIQTSNNEDDVFLDNTKSYEYSLHTHHHSQPDVSYSGDRLNAGRSQAAQLPLQYQLPSDSTWLANDFNHVRYSLYGAYQMQPMMVERSTLPVTCTQHVSPHGASAVGPPFHSPKMTREHVQSPNVTYSRNSVSTSQPPLPPLPPQSANRDNRMPLRNNLQTPIVYETQRLNSSPSPIPRHPKCKTLPRDMYSDTVSPLKRNKSDLHPSKAALYKEQSMAAMQEIKSNKVKKDSKNIMSILFAPFIHLRNKISRSKCNIDKSTNDSENDTDKSLQREVTSTRPIESQWPIIDPNDGAELLLSSPYHLVTPPKTSTIPTESSGHGSDSSSLRNRTTATSKQSKCRNKSSNNNSKNSSRQRPTSSGYGSIIIKGDSEVSSHNDSSSEYSISGANNSKMLSSHSRIKHSISLSNCKSIMDHATSGPCKGLAVEPLGVCTTSGIDDDTRIKNIATAHDLILQEKLKISLNEERKFVIQYIETNRLRGVPVDACVMNLICFKGVDNFEISSPTKREECRAIIEQIDQEIEQLKHKLTQAQNHLLLITTFDSK